MPKKRPTPRQRRSEQARRHHEQAAVARVPRWDAKRVLALLLVVGLIVGLGAGALSIAIGGSNSTPTPTSDPSVIGLVPDN